MLRKHYSQIVKSLVRNRTEIFDELWLNLLVYLLPLQKWETLAIADHETTAELANNWEFIVLTNNSAEFLPVNGSFVLVKMCYQQSFGMPSVNRKKNTQLCDVG